MNRFASHALASLALATLAASCGGDAATEKAPATDDFAELTADPTAAKEDAFSPSWRIVGSLTYGQTSAAVSYRNPPRYRAFKFAGQPGDKVDVWVRSTNGDPVAWLLDDSFRVLASNDDASRGNTNSHIVATLRANTRPEIVTYYIVFRDYDWSPGTFKVQLKGEPAGCTYDGQAYPVGADFPSTDGCNTCSCGPNGSVGCTKRACAQTCDYNGISHDVGDSFPSADLCNTCTCMAGGNVACTERACLPSCDGFTCATGRHCQVCRTANGPAPVCLPDGAVC
jgi:hypothetical protein